MEHVQLQLPAELLPRDLCGCQGGPPARVNAVAEIVRLRAQGHGPTAIARSLNTRAVPTPSGRGRWYPETVTRHADPAARARWASYIAGYRARNGR